jgi:hypothetical protein
MPHLFGLPFSPAPGFVRLIFDLTSPDRYLVYGATVSAAFQADGKLVTRRQTGRRL